MGGGGVVFSVWQIRVFSDFFIFISAWQDPLMMIVTGI